MIVTNIKMALASLRSARMRSFLTMLGIVIGVSSVVMVVSLGEGVKREVIGDIRKTGADLLIVRPGQPLSRNESGEVRGFNLGAILGASTLTEKDVADLSELANVEAVVPVALVAASPAVEGAQTLPYSTVVATTPSLKEALGQKLKHGSYLNDEESAKNVAVVGADIAEKMFQDESPIGRTFKVKGQSFVVRGVLERTRQNKFDLSVDYNASVFIPLESAKKLTGGALELRELDVKVTDTSKLSETQEAVRQAILKNHGGQEDFSVFQQKEFLDLTGQAFNLLTAFVAAIAGISLFVGGVGIMNIMLVSVTERTREIGIRKAIGATNRNILGQFLVEAVVLSVAGGFFGVLLAIGAAVALEVFTNISPAFEPRIIIIAVGLSLVVGVVFGITPALKAARKDPIEALRHD